MKVGILTIHDIYNYGSILQSFASLYALRKKNIKSEIIDYKTSEKNNYLSFGNLKKLFLKKTNSCLKDLLPGRPNSKYISRYAQAKKDWYSLSEKSYSSKVELVDKHSAYDACVVGSDQVWHPRTVSGDPSFFLDFVSDKTLKVSYASSFGMTTIPSQLVEYYRKHLSRLDLISVREKSGSDIIKGLINRNAEVVLDPTLLLNMDEWMHFSEKNNNNKPYILCYGNSSKDNYMERFAIHVQKFTGWDILRLNGKFYNYFDKKMEYVLDAGPKEWLGYMANASLILGQSYHATVFAVNFKRPFYSFLRGEVNHDARQKEFLSLIGLQKRSVVCGDLFPNFSTSDFSIDWSDSSSILEEERERSYNFIQRLSA